MNLIRNGGFEDGDLGFWVSGTVGVLTFDNIDMRTGSGCGKFTSSGAVNENVLNEDYIEVNALEPYTLAAYIKSAAARICRIYLLEYDQDLNLIGTTSVAEITAAAGYQKLEAVCITSDQTAYIRARVYMRNSLNGEIFFIDDVSINPCDMSKVCYGTKLLANLSAIGVSGNTNANRQDAKIYNTFIADLHVSAVAGVNPTLDVCVYELTPFYVGVSVQCFPQMIATGHQRIAIAAMTGNMVYIVYTIGGTNPVFDFVVYLTGKR